VYRCRAEGTLGVGLSAGATSAIHLALRHPERVGHLVVISGNLPGGRTAVAQPGWARMLYRDLPMWGLKAFLPGTMAYLAGVPKSYQITRDDAPLVSDFIDSMFPIAAKVRGVCFDAFVSNADVSGCRVEAINAPTLLVHAKDDPLASYQAAERIPGARLLRLASGGHLMLGQADGVRAELARFLAHRVAA
jgi:pimeloyl-ACP methyl ester carboxylesterase